MVLLWRTAKGKRRRKSVSSIVILNARPIIAVEKPCDDGGILIGKDNPVVPLDWYPFKPTRQSAALYQHEERRIFHSKDRISGILEADKAEKSSILSTDTEITVDDGLTDWGLPKSLVPDEDDDEEEEEDDDYDNGYGIDNEPDYIRQLKGLKLNDIGSIRDIEITGMREVTDIGDIVSTQDWKSQILKRTSAETITEVADEDNDEEANENRKEEETEREGATEDLRESTREGKEKDKEGLSTDKGPAEDLSLSSISKPDEFDDCVDLLVDQKIVKVNSIVRTKLGVFVVIMYIAVMLSKNKKAADKLQILFNSPRRLRRQLTSYNSSSKSSLRAGASGSQPRLPQLYRASPSSGRNSNDPKKNKTVSSFPDWGI